MTIFNVIFTIGTSALVGYLSYVLGHLRGLQRGLEVERPEVIQAVLEDIQQTFQPKKRFHIIPSRREKAEQDQELAENLDLNEWKKTRMEQFKEK